MEFALSTYLFVNERLTGHILDKILAAGISTLELFAARQHLDYHDSNHVRDVAQWFTDHELKLHSLHAPLYADHDWGRSGGAPISVTYLQRRLRINSMDEIKRAIEVADLLPFKYLVLHLGLPEEEYQIEKYDAAMTSLEHLRIYAKERGVQILLENVPNQLATPERLIQFIQYTRMNDLKLCFDTGHAHMATGVGPAFQILKERIVSTHVNDNHHEKDDHLLPFEGGIDWVQTVRDFRGAEGQFPCLFEIRNYSTALATLARLRETIEKIKAIS
jgi:sugar phosphate isomerase/epimerase